MVESSGYSKSFMRAAEELYRRTLIRDVDKKKGSPLVEEMSSVLCKAEEKRRERNMKEREKEVGDLGSHLRKSKENTDSGRLESNCKLDEWKMEDKKSEVQAEFSKESEHAGQDGLEAYG